MPAAALERRLGLTDAVATMVGIILGSGIFVAPAAVAAVAPSSLWAALIWLSGGAIALCGAMCYAECAARLPQSGGFFVYYERAFGQGCAQVAGLGAYLITYPASLTAMAWIAASYLHGMLPRSPLAITELAALLLGGTAVMVGAGVRFGALLQRVLTGSKLLAIAAVALGAIWVALRVGGEATLPAMRLPPLPLSPGLWLTAFATVMWTFDGWSDITMLSGEIKRPEVNLMRAAVLGVMIPAVAYAGLQLAVLLLLPRGQAMRSEHVLLDALSATGSRHAALFLGLLALVSAIGALHGVLSAVSRLGWSMARAGQLPAVLGRLAPATQTPLWALLVPWVMSLGYLYTNNFGELMGAFAFSVRLYYALTAVALWRLRRAGVGEGAALWRAPLGNLAPGVVLATAAVMTALQLVERPRRTLTGLSILALCSAIQVGRRRRLRRSDTSIGG